MKGVSFEVAKALKELGYPQGKGDVFIVKASNGWNEGEELSYLDAWHDSVPDDCLVCAPTYLEVWLWLWREKNIQIGMSSGTCVIFQHDILQHHFAHSDPEEAIIKSIDYLADNDLIK